MGKKDINTFIFFDGERAQISPNITPVFNFLMEIEKEIKTIVFSNKKRDSVRKKLGAIFDELGKMAKVLQDHNIDYKYSLTKDTIDLDEETSLVYPLRSQMICLFIFMETIFCLMVVYEYGLTDQDSIIKQTKNIMEDYIKKYILNDRNVCYVENKIFLSMITAKRIRKLRNGLIHFYKTDSSLSIVQHEGISFFLEKMSQAPKNLQQKFGVISPELFYDLLRSVTQIMLVDWTNDLKANPKQFKEQFDNVISVIASHAPVLVNFGDEE